MSQANTRPRIETESYDAPADGTDWRKLARLFGLGLGLGLVVALLASLLK